MAGRLKENLELIRSYKEDIGAAIDESGVVEAGQSMEYYADKIREINKRIGDDDDFVPEPGPQWTEEWEERGRQGTIAEYVVGDEWAPSLKVCLGAASRSSTTDFYIYWGDGTVTSSRSTGNVVYRHEYSEPGTYIVRVTDGAARIFLTGYNSSSTAVTTIEREFESNCRRAVRRVFQWGSSLTSLYGGLYYADMFGRGYADYDLPPFPPGITTLYDFMIGCTGYSGRIPYMRHLTKCTSCYDAYYNVYFATGHIQYPPPNVGSMANMYYQCMGLRGGIPRDFFPVSCTTAASALYVCSGLVGGYPELSHMVNCTSFASCFSNCYGLGSTGKGYPEFPFTATDPETGERYNDKVTSAGSMYDYNYCSVQTAYPDLKRLRACTSVASMFRGNFHCRGALPEFPPNVVSVGYAFSDNRNATGRFPRFPATVAGDCRQVFYYCQNVSSDLPPMPENATYITSMFNACRNATGKVPTLGRMTKVVGSSGAYPTAVFGSCNNLDGFEDGWEFLPVDAVNNNAVSGTYITTFESMFAYCYGLKELPPALKDLSAYTRVTSIASMFRETGITDISDMKLPPNVTNMSYTFHNCRGLKGGIPKWPAKLTNASYCYQYDFRLEDAWEGATPSQLVQSTVTTWTSCFSAVSQKFQKRIYDDCVSLGKSGTLTGVSNFLRTSQVEAVRKNGNGYMNLGARPYESMLQYRFVIGFRFHKHNASSTATDIFGRYHSGLKTSCYLAATRPSGTSNDQWTFRCRYGDALIEPCPMVPETDYVIQIARDGLTVNGTLYPWNKQQTDFLITDSLWFGGASGNSAYNNDISLRFMKGYWTDPATGEEMLRYDFVPVTNGGWTSGTGRFVDLVGTFGTYVNSSYGSAEGDVVREFNGT